MLVRRCALSILPHWFKAGNRWDNAIRAELERMDAFLRLVSVQFLDCYYVQHVELPRAKARHKNARLEIPANL